MVKEYYDALDGQWLTWQPLADSSHRVVARGLGDQGILQIGAFGTCGNPTDADYYSWRQETLLPILAEHGVADKVFNPEVSDWSPTRAPIEGIHMARDEVLTVAVTNQTGSHASIMEAGFAAYGGVLRGQDVIVSIEDNDLSPESTRVARMLARTVLLATESRYPLFRLVDNFNLLAHYAGMSLSERIRQRAGNVDLKTEFVLPPIRTDLDPTIYLTGTSGQQRPEWMSRVYSMLKKYKVPADDSYRANWNGGTADEELMHKLGNAVHLVAITSETDSFGALAELGPRIMYADLAGQSICVYIEEHEGVPNAVRNRTRILAKEHLSRLREDFPNLRVFVAEDLEQLAIVGMGEYFKQRQRLVQ